MGVGVIAAAESSSMADPLETGPRHDMASTARVMGPACVAARREPPGLSQWFFNFCRRCWINSVPHTPSRFTWQP